MKKTVFLISLLIFSFSYSFAQSSSLQDGLIVHYKFNGNSYDFSGNNFHTTSNATLTEDRFGNVNSAFHFNGINEYIDLPNISELKPNLPVTISFWAYFDDLDVTKTFMFTTDYAQNIHSGINLSLTSTTPRIAVAYGDGGAASVNSRRTKVGTSTIKVNTWYFIIVTIVDALDMNIYINEYNSGNLCSDDGGNYSGAGSNINYTTNPGSIGRKDASTIDNPYYFQGKIDEFKLWNRTLTSAEILSLCEFKNEETTNTAPEITASGNQIYCPLDQIKVVTSFDIIDPDETTVDAFYIQISEGYKNGEDKLTLLGIHPDITSSWNASEGKLTLKSTGSGPATYIDIIAAVKDVVFESSSPTVSGEKAFSFTIGDANYLPSTGHFYEYVAAPRITWKDAKIDAENKLYYGRQGYLATITTIEEAVLSGEQAAGQGWIGGSDEETEGVWKWVTGPEAGMVFWNGLANGSSPTGVYSNWANGEPNDWPNTNIAKEENYAHIYETGKWNDYPNFNNDIKGYVVEYGKPGDLPLNISASTTISVASITATTNDTRCGAGTLNLSATPTSGATVLWFDSSTSTTILHSGPNFTPSLSATTTFYVLASANGCLTGQRTAVTATVNPLPIIQTAFEFKNCDEDGIADGFTNFNLNEVTSIITGNDASLTVTYHLTASDANTSSSANPINPVPFNNATANTVYARVENTFGCFNVSTVKLSVSSTALPASFNYELAVCDRDANADGYFAFNLTQASTVFINSLPAGQPLSIHYFRNLNDAQLEQNEIPPINYINETKDSQILYVRVENNNDGNCFGIGPFLTLTVQQIPQFEVNSTAIVCLNLPPITLETFNPQGNYTYQWTDASGAVISTNSSAEVSTAGIYTVIAMSVLNCESFPKTVTVSASDIATITMNDITVVDDSNNNSITVNNINLGIGDYEFSLDAPFGPFQDETYFENLIPGTYTLYVNDKKGCGVAALDIAILGFPKFFTPNDDGQNDTWKVLGNDTNNIQISAIYIFDRFGKLVSEVDLNGDGWDGFYNGERLPASDYWYLVKYTDQYGDYREKRGNLSLIRR